MLPGKLPGEKATRDTKKAVNSVPGRVFQCSNQRAGFYKNDEGIKG